MANPVPVTITAPVGARLLDGFAVVLTLMNAPTTPLWEVDLTPPEMAVHGGMYDNTSVERAEYATQAPKWLRKTGPVKLTAGYSADAYALVSAQVGVQQPFMVTFLPSYDRIHFYGCLANFTPNPMRRGEMPTAEVVVEVTNQNPFGYEIRPSFTYGPTIPGKADFSRYDGSGLFPLFS